MLGSLRDQGRTVDGFDAFRKALAGRSALVDTGTGKVARLSLVDGTGAWQVEACLPSRGRGRRA